MQHLIINHQGHSIVNTTGALDGRRVPKELKGPLDTHWKIRDNEGYILNYDGTRSAVVHQWDRWYSEVVQFLDKKLLGFGKVRGKPGKPKSKPRPQAMKSEQSREEPPHWYLKYNMIYVIDKNNGGVLEKQWYKLRIMRENE